MPEWLSRICGGGVAGGGCGGDAWATPGNVSEDLDVSVRSGMPFEAPKPDNDGPASTFEGNNGSGVLVRALTPLRSMTETSRAETGAAVAGAPMPGTDMKSGVDADCPAACPAASVGEAPKPGNAGPESVLEGGEGMAAPTRAVESAIIDR